MTVYLLSSKYRGFSADTLKFSEHYLKHFRILELFYITTLMLVTSNWKKIYDVFYTLVRLSKALETLIFHLLEMFYDQTLLQYSMCCLESYLSETCPPAAEFF